jgi:hypothetical protein
MVWAAVKLLHLIVEVKEIRVFKEKYPGGLAIGSRHS